MSPRADDRKAELIERLVELIGQRLQPSEASLVARFTRLYYRDVAPVDMLERELLDLYGAALAHYRFAQTREPGRPAIRVYNPRLEQHGWQSTHTVVEIVTDDMPFLVDSVTMELNRNDYAVHLVIHPVMRFKRDAEGRLLDLLEDGAKDGAGEADDAVAESLMHVEIDRQSDQALLDALEGHLDRILGDVRRAVADWRTMRGKVDVVLDELEPGRRYLPAEDFEEIQAFLRWLADDHFTFLGFSSYDLEGEGEGLQLRRIKGSGLGIFRGYDEGAPSRSFQAMPLATRLKAKEPDPAIAIAKANTKSTVHRATYLDFIGVKRFDGDGRVIGENRFLGLFTSAAYNRTPREIPLLRRKVEAVIDKAGLDRSGHAGKALINILETYPRDELFQTPVDELYAIVTQILHLQDRQQIRLFLRRDSYGRYVSCLVYVPRERYNTALRQRIQAILEAAIDSRDTEYQAQVSEAMLARILFVIRTPKGIPDDLDPVQLEQRIVEAAQSWSDRLKEALFESEGEERGNALFRNFGHALPVAYQERIPARAAVPDILAMDGLRGKGPDHLAMSLYRRLEDAPSQLRFKMIRPKQPIYLSDALPIFENMGLKVLSEEPYDFRDREGELYSLHDFGMQPFVADRVDIDDIRADFQDTFYRVWKGEAENDGFNRLVVIAGLDAREIIFLRAYGKYIQQIGSPFSQAYVEQTFASNPGLARDLVGLFRARFDPDAGGDREAEAARLREKIEAGLEQVAILDEDRILRRYLGLIEATLRTNAFQRDARTGEAKDYVSLKFDPARVPEMPLPRPAFEIFVYAPYVEGVHLRGGKVARGGLRWSDRREDFRTEVLGLMKAQMVKNSVIVPVGAKGGFVVKRPPQGGGRQALQEEGIRCYRTFLSGMLDITDNQVRGKVVPPERVVRYDEDDPYLVVAADKGTATFSDIANEVSRSYGFWLDDAFASGGSAGYDHKGMGITAKGAWESVKRHFREMGMDPQEDVFTCVGIGDMSGDVFGNGMLLSDKIKLLAAFDHRHIFIDPDPDPAASFAERERLFAMGRSTWDDYDRSKMSAGGGIYPRTTKSITLSEAARKVLDVEAESFTPHELIQAILKAPVDLWWNGGIGTYVKASSESHADAQDRASDPVRIDGRDLRARILGEGGNLGLTQLGRIEAARMGVRINTDFIDNSAGVDCSDHEVNIKILLGEVVAAGDMTMKQRDHLLAEMTDEVAVLCLRDNILQNLALSIGQARGAGFVDAQIRFMRKLEREGRLSRELELLPDDQALIERQRQGQTLTRPEAAVLLSYAKLTIYADLLETDLPDREYFVRDLAKYFPKPIRRRFADEIGQHRLRREIVATWLANSMVNRGLETFVSELEDETGGSLADIAMAYVVTRDAFSLLPVWGAIENLPKHIPADVQLAMLAKIRQTLMRGTRWFLGHLSLPISIREVVPRFRPTIAAVITALEEVVSESHQAKFERVAGELVGVGVEEGLAKTVSALPFHLSACNIVAVTERATGGGQNPEELDPMPAARIYFALEDELDLTWLRTQLHVAPIGSRWDRMALSELEEDLSDALRGLSILALEAGCDSPDGSRRTTHERVAAWLDRELPNVRRYRDLIRELQAMPSHELPMLAVSVSALGDLLPSQ